jgi:hypothetical protein
LGLPRANTKAKMKNIGGRIDTYLRSLYGESLSDKSLIVRNLLRVLLKNVKVKLSLCLIKQRVMKVYVEVEV